MLAGGDRKVAQQVELAVSGIDDLWLLPSVAAKLFSIFFQKNPEVPSLEQIIEADASLSAKILSLLTQQGVSLPQSRFSFKTAIDKLSGQTLQQELLSIELAEDLQLVQIGSEPKGPSKKELVLHNCAVACAAGTIAQKIEQGPDEHTCYLAGLLHDIGKMALAKAMPKSFLRIAEEAKSNNSSFSEIEQVHFGLDHAALGQRLARKWDFPEPITLAIWLHHNQPQAIAQYMPQVQIAQVVQVADFLARQCGLGDSGSCDAIELDEQATQSIGLSEKSLDQIRQELPEQVQQKCKLLGLDEPQTPAAFSEAAYLSALQLAADKNSLFEEVQQLRKTSGLFEFIKDFLSGVTVSFDIYSLARRLALCWQRHYQTGPVCIYFKTFSEDEQVTVVLAEGLSQTNVLYVNLPEEITLIPQPIENRFDIIDAHDHLKWLFNQISLEFDYQQTKLLPLLSGNRAVGAIVFELRYPADLELFHDSFKTSASIGASLLGIEKTAVQQRRYAETFAQLLSVKKEMPPHKPEPSNELGALAEMAAGAAHELNNPLSVISGRVQLLEQSESDEEKKKTLQQIRNNIEEVTHIIDDLMSFAQPSQPRPQHTSIQLMLDEATQLTAQRVGLEKVDIELHLEPDIKEVFIDSAQIVSSLANVFSNAIESYQGKTGTIEVKVDSEPEGDSVILQIIDQGCGMEPQTLSKAAYPFFSSKAAGRKRGMGLAYAQRLIQLNSGRMQIQSQTGSGTTVTVSLPTSEV
ncbi:MAG: HDOD domain-containing protein [Planctomycetota bacterium]|jgi:putative nucleotidyltransferase with HDIG domain